VRIDLYAQMGRVYERGADREFDRAIEPTTSTSASTGFHVALGALSRTLYREDSRIGIAPSKTRRGWSSSPTTMGTRVELHQRVGRIYEERLAIPTPAEGRYADARALDPDLSAGMQSLTSLYRSAATGSRRRR